MELEPMFTEQKWNILKCLSNEKLSPLQLAANLNTTMANISQQLRLLEAADLVKKEKIKNRDKGKPRALFSLTNDYAYLVSTMKRFADKRLLKVTDHHKTILRIWFLKDPELHYELERIYWKIEPHIRHIDLIAVDESNGEIIIVSDRKDIEKTAKSGLRVFPRDEAARMIKRNKSPFSDELTIIHDPNRMLMRKNGGEC